MRVCLACIVLAYSLVSTISREVTITPTETRLAFETTCAATLPPGPCTIDRLPMAFPLPTPRSNPAVFYPVGAESQRNIGFAETISKDALIAHLGNESVRLTSSNTYSDGEVIMTLKQYLTNLNALSSGACGRAANETVYLFGGNYSPAWTQLLSGYDLPPCKTCKIPKDNAAVSFGVGGALSGVSWHSHGAGFSEVRRKRDNSR